MWFVEIVNFCNLDYFINKQDADLFGLNSYVTSYLCLIGSEPPYNACHCDTLEGVAFRYQLMLQSVGLAGKAFASLQPQRRRAVDSITAQDNYLCVPKLIVLSSVGTLPSIIVFIKSLSLDIDEKKVTSLSRRLSLGLSLFGDGQYITNCREIRKGYDSDELLKIGNHPVVVVLGLYWAHH